MAQRAIASGLCVVVLFTAGCRKAAVPPPPPDVWAVVNGAEIRRERVDRFYQAQINPAARPPTDEETVAAKLGVLADLITNELLLAEARTLKLEPSDADVDKAVAERRGALSDADFAKQLDQRRVTAAEFRAEVRRDLTVQKVLEREVTTKIVITDQEVTEFYGQNRQQFNVAERQYHLAQIVINPDRNPQVNNRKGDDAATPEEARRKVELLTGKLRAGESFAELAADYSEDPQSAPAGGDLGFVSQTALDRAAPDLRRAVMGMTPGNLNTVTSRGTVTLLALVARQEPGQRELSDASVQEAIRNGLKERREQLLQAAYVTRLLNGATVVNYLARQVVDAHGKLPAAAK